MENANSNNVIDLNKKKSSGRPRLSEEEIKQREELKKQQALLKERIKTEINMIKKAIPALINAGFAREQILNLSASGKDYLNPYIEQIDDIIKEEFNRKSRNNEKTNGVIKFKDIKVNKDGDVTGFKSTVENFKAILDFMALEFKFNVITNDIDIFRNGVIQPKKSKWKGEIYSVAQRYDCKIAPQDIGMFINTVSAENQYNPWEDYVLACFDKHKDNEELMKYKTIHQLFSTITIRNAYDVKFAFLLFKKFLLHFIASFQIEDYGCNGVFILQGPQNFGKTSFFEQIVPKGFFKEGLAVNPESDDSVRKVLKYQLVELGEIESTLRADVNKLKNFITEKTFAFRKQYSDYVEDNKRHTVLCGTCNSDEFLKDETGDRRYWVIPIVGINFEILNNIDLELLWAEVYMLFQEEENKIPLINGIRRKHCHELDRTESSKLININKEDFTFKSTQQVKIESVFDWSKEERYYISTATLALKVFNELIIPPKIGATLKSLGVEKSKKRLYGNKTPQWYYSVPPLIDSELMREINPINVENVKSKKDLIDKLGTEVEVWE